MRPQLLGAVVALAACAPVPQYSVRRAALAPPMAPVAYAGQPMPQPIELALGSSSIVRAGEPTDGSDGMAGLYVPRFDVNGALRGRVGDGSLAVLFDSGFADQATGIARDMPRPRASTTGIGVGFAYSFGSGPLRVGIATELLEYSVSYRQTWTCVKNCDQATAPPAEDGSENVGVLGMGVVPSYRMDRWVFFGSFTVRNHPTIEKSEVVSTYVSYPPHVDDGPWNTVIGAGVQADLTGNLRALVELYLPVAGAPVVYTPTLAASLAVGLGR